MTSLIISFNLMGTNLRNFEDWIINSLKKWIIDGTVGYETELNDCHCCVTRIRTHLLCVFSAATSGVWCMRIRSYLRTAHQSSGWQRFLRGTYYLLTWSFVTRYTLLEAIATVYHSLSQTIHQGEVECKSYIRKHNFLYFNHFNTRTIFSCLLFSASKLV